MNKAERVRFILDRLQALYPEPPVPLDHSDPFTLLVAVYIGLICNHEGEAHAPKEAVA